MYVIKIVMQPQFAKRLHMMIPFFFQTGIAAVSMALLVERGHLDYEEKVVHYWPEFGQNGKENVTVKMLLNHEVSNLNSTAH